jgi:hypothetical protein
MTKALALNNWTKWSESTERRSGEGVSHCERFKKWRGRRCDADTEERTIGTNPVQHSSHVLLTNRDKLQYDLEKSFATSVRPSQVRCKTNLSVNLQLDWGNRTLQYVQVASMWKTLIRLSRLQLRIYDSTVAFFDLLCSRWTGRLVRACFRALIGVIWTRQSDRCPGAGELYKVT